MLWQHLSHRLLFGCGGSPCFDLLVLAKHFMGGTPGPGEQIEAELAMISRNAAKEVRALQAWRDLSATCRAQRLRKASQSLLRQSSRCPALLPTPAPSRAPVGLPCSHHAHETLLLCTKACCCSALVVQLLAECSLAQICICARGKRDLQSLPPSPNILFLTPLHAFPGVSLHFGESPLSQRTNIKRSKRRLNER